MLQSKKSVDKEKKRMGTQKVRFHSHKTHFRRSEIGYGGI